MHNTHPLWLALRAMFTLMQSSIGAPLAERTWIDANERKRIYTWFAPVVAMVRKVVLIEALLLARDAVLGPRRPKSARATPTHTRERKPTIRVWPRPKRSHARIRQLGPPVLVRDIWRDQAQQALARQLAAARAKRPPSHVTLARRFDALAKLIREPQRAIRALARKLLRERKFALVLAAKRTPRTRLFQNTAYDGVWGWSFDLAIAHARADTS